jgi:hypothetical protein
MAAAVVVNNNYNAERMKEKMNQLEDGANGQQQRRFSKISFMGAPPEQNKVVFDITEG